MPAATAARIFLLLVSLPQLLMHAPPHSGSALILPSTPAPFRLGTEGVRLALHLVGGRGGGAWRGRAEADEDRAAEYDYGLNGDAGDGFDPDEEYGGGYGATKEYGRYAKQYAMEKAQDLHDNTWAASDPRDTASADGAGEVALVQSESDAEDDSGSEWAEKETMFMKRRREEETALVGAMGGDLSMLAKNKHGLKTRDWDRTFEEMKRDTLDPDGKFVPHKERKRREEDAQVLAAGGGLDKCFLKPQPNVFERDMLARAADAPGEFISTKARKQQQEQDLIKSFGGNLSEMSSRDRTKLQDREWDDAPEGKTLPTFKERKKKEEEEALRAFGGALDNCMAKHESALEREKRLSKFNRKKKKPA